MRLSQDEAVVLRFAVFLRQPCSKMQGNCMMVAQHSFYGIHKTISGCNLLLQSNEYLACLAAALQQPYSSLTCLSAILCPTIIARKMKMSKIYFLMCQPCNHVILRCCAQHLKTATRNPEISCGRQGYGHCTAEVKHTLVGLMIRNYSS